MLVKTCRDKISKSSKLKKLILFSSCKFSPLPQHINVESGRILFLKPWNVLNNTDLGNSDIFTEKRIFYFVSTILSKIVGYWYYLKKKNALNCWMVFKCMLVHCMISIQSMQSSKSDLYVLMLIFSIKIRYFWRLPSILPNKTQNVVFYFFKTHPNAFVVPKIVSARV